MVDPLLLNRPAQRIQALMLAAPRPIAVAAVLELHFVDGLQYPFDRQLHQLVFETADAQRPPLLASRLRDVAAPLRLWAVAHGPKSLRQRPEIPLQLACVLLLAHAINPHRPVPGQCFEAGTQVVHVVDMMIQTGEYQLRIAARLLAYPS